ncbi:MAG TPA: alpha/beta hydrolase [Nitrospiria bacterium]|nr:alpha/beta hydrolase [Nitrospiria bacterium]
MIGFHVTEQRGQWVAGDGTPLVYNAVYPDSSVAEADSTPLTPHSGSPRAVVLIVHGMSEYKGRYHLLQEELAGAGLMSYAYDQRGFGESGGIRTYVRTYHQYLDDLALVVESIRKKHSSLPLFLVGHSLGGLITLSFCIRDQPVLQGVVVSAPVVMHTPPPFRIRFLAYLLSRILPRLSVVYGNEVKRFTHDQKVIDDFLNDPFCQNAGTPRFYTEMQRMRRNLLRDAPKFSLPLLILQGTGDQIVLPKGAQFLYDRVRSGDKRLIWYEGFFHESFNEIGRERVVADTIQWIADRIPAKTTTVDVLR